MIAFIGLGNSGNKYQKTKHNAGFWVLDEWAERQNLLFKPGKGEYLFAQSKKREVVLVKPLVGMNNSGVAVKEIMNHWNLNNLDLFVIIDDVDLPLGKVRVKPKGGDGCHRGLENIIYHLNSNKFPRIRFGIGTEDNMRPAEKYVLKPFKKEKLKELEFAINKAVDVLDNILINGLGHTMNHFN
jgi:peptidyl-tRNA hydrolase, PTH1 family